jgi:hypothetical protein
VVIAYEVIHSLHKIKQPGVIINLGNGKAYHRVNLDLPLENFATRDFGKTWIGWIRKIILGDSVSISGDAGRGPRRYPEPERHPR